MTTSLTITDAHKLASSLTKDARSMLPQSIRTPGEALAVIMAGQELGLPPMTALREVVLIKGKVTLSAQLMLAMMKRGGVRHTWEHTDAKGATLTLQRGEDAPFTSSFTIEDAQRAGIASHMYKKWPAAMLRARCISAAARAYCPDLLMGVYVHGELDDPEPIDVTPEPEQPPAPAIAQRWSDKERAAFCARLGELGAKYDDVRDFCTAHGRPKPSEAGPEVRARLVQWLEDPDGLARLEEWCGQRDENDAAEAAEGGE